MGMIAEMGRRAGERRILYIAGAWRSGSTLLGDLLGAALGFCHVGELHHVWSRGLARNWLCGCGEPFRTCGFWRQVIESLGDDAEAGRARELEELRLAMARKLGSGANPEDVLAEYPRYVEAMDRLARAVFAASGVETIVDSSKSYRHACTLLAGGAAPMVVVHLVRDPRATIYSLVERPKQRVDDPNRSTMLRPGVHAAIDLWIRSNHEAERLGELTDGYVVLRYEDLVAEPTQAVKRIARWAGALLGECALALAPSHTISGNPDRLKELARKEIRLDDEWSRRMAASMRESVEEQTRAWMDKYGYRQRW